MKSTHRFTPEKLQRVSYAKALLDREPLGQGGIAVDRLEHIARLASLELADVRRIVRGW
jgi:hypothetical protein